MNATTVTTKRCPKCCETKPADGFYRNRSKLDGLDSYCKECSRAYMNAWRRSYREANPEEYAAKCRASYDAHREKKLAYSRSYRKDHREEEKARHRIYREAHREELRKANRDRRALIGKPRDDQMQLITAKHATRRGRWSEAEDAYLIASTDRIVDDALALKRTYSSTQVHISHLRKRGVTLARDSHRR